MSETIYVHVIHHFDGASLGLLRRIASALEGSNLMERNILMNLQDIQTKADATLTQVQSDTNVVNSVKTVVDHQNSVLTDLQSQIRDLQSQNDPQALQKLSDTIDAIMQTDMANSQVVSSAVAAGTPSDPNAGGASTPSTPPSA